MLQLMVNLKMNTFDVICVCFYILVGTKCPHKDRNIQVLSLWEHIICSP